MAEAASFDESNRVLSRPPDMSDDQCSPLSIMDGEDKDGNHYIVSCWKITPAELEEIQRTGRIWLLVYGQRMPPVAVTCHKFF